MFKGKKSFNREKVKGFLGKINRDIMIWLVISLILTGIIAYMQKSKFNLFILNYLMFLSVTSIALLFKKSKSIYFFIAAVITILATASKIMMKLRGTPLTAGDIYSFKEGISMAEKYMGKSFIPIVIIAIVILILILVIIFRKEKSNKNYSFKKSLLLVVITFIITFSLYEIDNGLGIIKTYNWDLSATYSKNGFLVSYYKSIRELKPAKPNNYTKGTIERIKNNLASEKAVSTNSEALEPNIIVVQLESFLDPYRLSGIKLSKDPISNIRNLESNGPHGLMLVPTFGGGTVRTEFEVLTGYSVANLGAGEIPNNTILKQQPVESMANILKDDGYDVTAIHNYEGNFYDRDTVYSNFGFDKFVSMEYINDLKYNDYNGQSEYPADISNIEPIKKLLDNEDKPQFIFNVAVESHGPYSDSYVPKDGKYTVSGDITEGERNQLQEYVDRLSAVDEYVQALVNTAKASSRPTVIAFYSDHLPMLQVVDNPKIFDGQYKYEANYFIWSNMDNLTAKEENISAYQLSTYILQLAGIKNGIMPNFHKNNSGAESYLNDFKNLQYDQLNGENYLGASKAKKAENITLGLEPIEISSASLYNGILTVKGENFNSSSKIFVDNKEQATEFVNSTELIAYSVNSGKNANVCQVGRSSKKLSSTKEIKLS
ncbi:MAG: sulfatase-like hydrolase/transferase [Sarcina sp.]